MKTDQKILNAALSILMENGFQALTQTRVADIAGVSQGNLTYYFPSRTDLLKAVVAEVKVKMCAIRTAEVGEGALSWSKLEDIMMCIPFSDSMPQLMLALTVARDEDPSLADWFASHDVAALENFRVLLARLGVQTDDATLYFIRSAMVGAALMHLQQNSKKSEEVARGIIKSACGYLRQNVTPLPSE